MLRRLRSLTVVSLAVTTSLSVGVSANDSVAPKDMEAATKCVAGKLGVALDELLNPAKARYSDLLNDTSWIYWGRLKQVLELNPRGFEKVFSSMTEKDFNELWALTRAGEIRLSGDAKERELQDRLLIDLHDFLAEDTEGRIWQVPAEQRYVWAINELNKIDKRHGSETALNAVETLENSAMGKAEKALLARAVGEYKGTKYENTRSTDGMRRFFRPLYRPVESILAFNNELRRSLRHGYAVDEAIKTQSLDRATNLRLTADEQTALRFLLAKNAQNSGEIRGVLKDIYGQEPSYKTGIDPQKLNIAEIAKRAKTSSQNHSETAFQESGEKRLDKLDELLNNAQVRAGAGPRTTRQNSDLELQLRHNEKQRKMGETQESYYKSLSTRSEVSYRVDYSWDEPVYKTVYDYDTDGNLKGSHQELDHYERKHDSVTRRPSYEEILRNQYNTSAPRGSVDSITGLKEIQRSTEQLRQREAPLWSRVEDIQKQMGKFLEAHSQNIQDANRAGVVSQLDQLRAQVQKETAAVLEYYKWTSDKVASQWNHDKFNDFRARNYNLVQRYDNLTRYLDYYAAQVERGQKDVALAYNSIPSYPEELNYLRNRYRRNIAIKSTIGVATVGGATAAYLNPDKIQSFMDWVKRSAGVTSSDDTFKKPVESHE